jgi:octaprenyl-diphosphate synthase
MHIKSANIMQIEDIYKSVQNDFSAANTLILEQLNSRVPLVEKIAQYIIESGGKRMRPLITLLSARALGYDGDKHIKLATIIEFLHTATLLHDDVVDTSDMRRGKSTANAQWGNAPSVLVGDFLYSRAFQMMVEIGNMDVMHILANATNVIAEGEVFQLMNAKNPNISEQEYFTVIQNKTAMLFEAATHSASQLATTEQSAHAALKTYGLQLGLAFQLIDDILDYTGDAETMGKNVGDDLAEGKLTLPLIYAIQHSEKPDADFIKQAIRKGDISAIEEVSRIVRACGALDYTLNAAYQCRDKACLALDLLDDNVHVKALKRLATLSVERNK